MRPMSRASGLRDELDLYVLNCTRDFHALTSACINMSTSRHMVRRIRRWQGDELSGKDDAGAYSRGWHDAKYRMKQLGLCQHSRRLLCLAISLLSFSLSRSCSPSMSSQRYHPYTRHSASSGSTPSILSNARNVVFTGNATFTSNVTNHTTESSEESLEKGMHEVALRLYKIFIAQRHGDFTSKSSYRGGAQLWRAFRPPQMPSWDPHGASE